MKMKMKGKEGEPESDLSLVLPVAMGILKQVDGANGALFFEGLPNQEGVDLLWDVAHPDGNGIPHLPWWSDLRSKGILSRTGSES